ncbi:MAG: 1-deoxy-D-xylulose-5-phosphate reductoisomerase [Myxococcota bacterium]
MKRLAVLGSTGSIGTQVLSVAESHLDRLEIVGLAAGRNTELLVAQARRFRPALVSVADGAAERSVRDALAGLGVRVVAGAAGLLEIAEAGADLVVGGLVGRLGLEPVLAALRKGTDVALANKEVLVMAGPLVLEEARRSGAEVLPLDSEHVAIHQAMAGHPRDAVKRVVLTASGGAFRNASLEEMEHGTPEEALAHPNWDMGPKVTIDSATLMNKGLEVIEARWLFDLEPDQIDVVIHPESIVHSLVEYVDGSWLAQLAVPDMRVPIAYALGMPERLCLPEIPALDLVKLGALHFEAPDPARFPCLELAWQAVRAGGTVPAALNAGNERAVEAFLAREIPFRAIPATVEAALERTQSLPGRSLPEILEVDREAREHAQRFVQEYRG